MNRQGIFWSNSLDRELNIKDAGLRQNKRQLRNGKILAPLEESASRKERKAEVVVGFSSAKK